MKNSSLNLTTLTLLVACAAGCSRAEETTPLDELTLLAKHTDPNMRYSAMEQIGRVGPEAGAAVPALIEGLRDKSPMVRLGAAYALGNLGKEASSAAAPLAQSLKDPDRQVRLAAAFSLPALGPAAQTVVPELEKRVHDPDPEVRNQAARSLKAIRNSTRVRQAAERASTTVASESTPAPQTESRRRRRNF